MTQVDPSFTALPYRQWPTPRSNGPTISGQSRRLRFEQGLRSQRLVVRDGVLQGASDSEDVGFHPQFGSIHQGAWGFASGVMLTPEEASGRAETPLPWATSAAAMTSRPVELGS